MTNTKTLIPVLPQEVSDPVSRSRWILCVFFCVGAVLGTVFGRFSSTGDLFRPLFWTPAGAADFLWLMWCFSWPCLIAVFLSSSFAGHWLMAVLFAVRGFLLSSAVAVLLKCGFGLPAAWGRIGLPALFSLAALFLIGEKAFDSSLALCRLCSGRTGAVYRFIPAERLVAAAALLFMAAASRQFLIPLLR